MEQDILNNTLKEIADGHVYAAICNMRNYAMHNSIGKWRDELESLTSDYELMMDYLGRGIVTRPRYLLSIKRQQERVVTWRSR